jgi:hypothetical protein
MFTIAHLLAEPLGYPADGFSTPYQFAIQTGSLLFALIALWYFRKLYLLFFSDKIVAIILLLLVFGTNYLDYSAIDPALTHNWLFGGYVFLLLNTINFHKTPSFKYAIGIGTVCGVMILIRPSEMISVLIPLLWGIERVSVAAFKTKFTFLYKHRSKLAVSALCIILIGLVQVAYWLYVTGQPFVYSYQHIGFAWDSPFIYEYTLSARSGWITYSPLALLVFIGIPVFIIYGRNKVAVLFFLLLNLYIVSSWEIWWYGGRAMVQSYPVIFFPFAHLISYIYSRKWLTIITSPIILLLAYVSIWWTYNAHAAGGLFDANGMSRSYYRRVVGRFAVPGEVYKLKDTKEIFEGTPQQMTRLYLNDFENENLPVNDSDAPIPSSRFVFVNGAVERTKAYAVAIPNGYQWVRVSGTFKCGYEPEPWRMPQFVARMEKDGKEVKGAELRIARYLKPGKSGIIYLDMKVPEDKPDSLKISLWRSEGKASLAMDDLEVWGFNE